MRRLLGLPLAYLAFLFLRASMVLLEAAVVVSGLEYDEHWTGLEMPEPDP